MAIKQNSILIKNNMSNLNKYAIGYRQRTKWSDYKEALITATIIWSVILIIGQVLIYIQTNY